MCKNNELSKIFQLKCAGPLDRAFEASSIAPLHGDAQAATKVERGPRVGGGASHAAAQPSREAQRPRAEPAERLEPDRHEDAIGSDPRVLEALVALRGARGTRSGSSSVYEVACRSGMNACRVPREAPAFEPRGVGDAVRASVASPALRVRSHQAAGLEEGEHARAGEGSLERRVDSGVASRAAVRSPAAERVVAQKIQGRPAGANAGGAARDAEPQPKGRAELRVGHAGAGAPVRRALHERSGLWRRHRQQARAVPRRRRRGEHRRPPRGVERTPPRGHLRGEGAVGGGSEEKDDQSRRASASAESSGPDGSAPASSDTSPATERDADKYAAAARSVGQEQPRPPIPTGHRA